MQRWFNRWDENKLGWHRQDPHAFLLKYGSHIVPNFNAADNSNNECRDESQNTCEAADKEDVNNNGARIFVPLCGKTVDMNFLAKHDGVQEVVGCDGIRKALLDFVQENSHLNIREVISDKGEEEQETNGNHDLIASSEPFEKFVGDKITLLKGDYFDLNLDVMEGKLFDGILDRASMVAIQPDLREQYVEILGNLIQPGGTILLITIDRREGTEEGKSAGPPFSINDDEVQRLFGSLDWVESIEKVEEIEEDITDYRMPGVDRLFELVFVIKARSS